MDLDLGLFYLNFMLNFLGKEKPKVMSLHSKSAEVK